MPETLSGAQSYRTRTISERIALAVPSSAAFAPVRRLLKPIFERTLSRRGGLRSVLPGGEVLAVAPAYRHVTWNAEEYAAFRAAIREGDVILEAGANVGAYTMLFAGWTGPDGHVYAFEPDEAAFRGLERHLALNGLSERVTPVAAAIGDDKTDRLRFATFASSGISRMAGDREEPGTIVSEVPACSIDRFCAQHDLAPTFLKIDVEGAELVALRGARRTIAAAGSRLQLFVEMHPHLWPAFGITAEDVRRECRAQGLIVERLDGAQDDVWTIEGVCLRLRPAAAS